MNLEEKFQDYINKAQRNYDFTISPSVLIHDLALIAGNDCVDKIGDMIKTMEDYDVKIQQLEEDYQLLQGINWKNIEYMGKKIDKLEKENATLKAQLTANRFIYNTNERHKYQDKIEELENKLKEVKNV